MLNENIMRKRCDKHRATHTDLFDGVDRRHPIHLSRDANILQFIECETDRSGVACLVDGSKRLGE